MKGQTPFFFTCVRIFRSEVVRAWRYSHFENGENTHLNIKMNTKTTTNHNDTWRHGQNDHAKDDGGVGMWPNGPRTIELKKSEIAFLFLACFFFISPWRPLKFKPKNNSPRIFHICDRFVERTIEVDRIFTF